MAGDDSRGRWFGLLAGIRVYAPHSLGRRAGLGPDQLARVAAGSDADGWTERERTILRAVEQLVGEGDIDDDTWARLRMLLSEPQCIELCLLVGHYEMVATTVATLRIPLDRERPRGRR